MAETTPSQLAASWVSVAGLYPYQPSLSLWRSWEHVAYSGQTLAEPVLDLGCGDSRFFRLLWPDANPVLGFDRSAAALSLAGQRNGYQQLVCGDSGELPFQPGAFGSVFSNCVLEHLSDPTPSLTEIHRCLRPGGQFLFSVVTEELLNFFSAPWHAQASQLEESAIRARETWTAFHTMKRTSTQGGWAAALEATGFKVDRQIPIVPEITARVFLFFDVLWHERCTTGEVGPHVEAFLSGLRDFPVGFGKIAQALQSMEREDARHGGVVFLATIPR